MTRPKRNFNRLAPSTWSEICALWEIGDVTLPELAERYSVSTRTLQTHFAKHKVEKGSKAAALATSVKEEIYETKISPFNGPVRLGKKRTSRDSPDDSQTGVSIRVLRPCCKTDARCGPLPAQRAARMVAEAGDLAIFPGIGTHSSHLSLLNA